MSTTIGQPNRRTSGRLKSLPWRVALAMAVCLALLTIIYFPYTVDSPHLSPGVTAYNREVYRSIYTGEAPAVDPNDIDYQRVKSFVEEHGLHDARVLEVGAGRGKLQDIVPNYTGLDISESSARYFRKPFVQASATAMPFPDNSFDVVWTINVIEHVPYPEHALSEIRRVLRNGGHLYMSPAWQCRSWAAEGYQVRPWADFGLEGRLIKASIPLRDSVAYRSLYSFPIRILRTPFRFLGPTRFRYSAIEPNYDKFWQSDSDAVNSMDGYEVIIWFTSRGDACLNYPSFFSQMLFRNGPIIFRINKA